MNKKTLFTILIIIVLLISGVALIYWYVSKQTTPSGPEISKEEVSTDTGRITGDGLKLEDGSKKEEKPESIQPSDAKLLSTARYFVERWGTYSNQSDFQNIRDLRPVMTDDFFNEVYSRYKPLSYNELNNIDYEGYETKVVSINWESKSDQEATALVTTNRRHLSGENVETYPQDIRITLIKQADSWVVATAVWQER